MLKLDEQINFFAIVSPDTIYKLAWQLNNHLDLKLRESLFSEKDETVFFAEFNHYYSVILLDSNLLSSSKLKKIDFILVTHEADITTEDLRMLPGVQMVRDAKDLLNKKDSYLLVSLILK